jgi:hypothetical protein
MKMRSSFTNLSPLRPSNRGSDDIVELISHLLAIDAELTSCLVPFTTSALVVECFLDPIELKQLVQSSSAGNANFQCLQHDVVLKFDIKLPSAGKFLRTITKSLTFSVE